MFESLVNLLGGVISLLEEKEAHKYADQYVELKKRYYEELNKPDGERDDSVVDRTEHELCVLADAIAISAGKQGSQAKP